MRAACVIVLACVTVIRGQMMAGESDPSLHELFQTLLARDHGNADEFLLPPAGPEKRQHPGRREDADDEEEALLQKRQHPGRREAEEAARVTRQHPGKRWDPDAPSELSKRQHPGKRYLMLLHKRQHPGRREDSSDLEKRQHPGKRFWEEPCEDCDPAGILLQLLDDGTKSRSEEKRQHPGKRLDVEDDLTELE